MYEFQSIVVLIVKSVVSLYEMQLLFTSDNISSKSDVCGCINFNKRIYHRIIGALK